MLYFAMLLISCIDAIKYIFKKPSLTGKISHWQMLLFEFDIMFMVRKAIKGQAIADHLVDQPLNVPDFSESLFPDEDVLAIKVEPSNVEPWCWKFYFNIIANNTRKSSGSNSSIPKGPVSPCFSQTEFWLYKQCHRVRGMHSGLTSHLGVWRI